MAKWARLYALLLAAAAVLLAIWLPQGGRIETDFAALLPADAGIDELWRAADQANERALNGQILLLVGASDAEQAIAAAEKLLLAVVALVYRDVLVVDLPSVFKHF